MTARLIVLLALAAILPAASLAEGCHDRAKMSCSEGAVWDDQKQVCAPKPTS